ncbi:MAG: electron transfer flavoprotein subunit alpha/FixB family protein, partial [Allomuricauda sp.]
MSVLVYTESDKGAFKKNALEVASYAYKVAQDMGESVTAVAINAGDETSLGNYGVSKVLKVSNGDL